MRAFIPRLGMRQLCRYEYVGSSPQEVSGFVMRRIKTCAVPSFGGVCARCLIPRRLRYCGQTGQGYPKAYGHAAEKMVKLGP